MAENIIRCKICGLDLLESTAHTFSKDISFCDECCPGAYKEISCQKRCLKCEERMLGFFKPIIANLRNRRNIHERFAAFCFLVNECQEQILNSLNLRWLISICDTYVDYGTPVERRNALLVSLFVNLFRIADTYLITQNYTDDEEMIDILSQQQIPLSLLKNETNGLMTLSLAKQDTCLNLAKRLDVVLEETPFFHAIYRKAIEIFLKESPLLSGFVEISAQPERIFPENAREISDNYGII